MAKYKATALLHLYLPYHNAGGETTAHDLFRAMVETGDWDVDVILSREMPEYSEPYQIDGVQVFPFTDKRQIIRAVNKSDLLISHLENSDRVGTIGKKYRTPVVHIIHNNMEITKGYVAHGCDLAVFNTQWVADDFLASGYKGKSVVVHPRVDVSRYTFAKNHKKADQQYITLVNLWSGTARGNNGKGSETFYQLAKLLPEKKFLGVIGAYGQQDVRDYPNVTVVPHTSDILNQVYSKTRILLMPSRYESFGRVAIEGASAGIPTIASDTPGLREALGEDFWFLNPDKYEDWESVIQSLDNPRNYNKASRNAKARAKYWSDQQERELEAYLGAVNSLASKTKTLRGW